MSVSAPASFNQEVLFEHRRFLLALSASLVRDEHLAEDLVQEAWVRALERPPKAAQALREWLGTVVRNLAWHHLTREAARSGRERDLAKCEAFDASPSKAEEELEVLRRILRELRRMPEPYRTTLTLRYMNDRLPADIARSTSVPLKTVKTRLLRGLKLLRQAEERRRRPA